MLRIFGKAVGVGVLVAVGFTAIAIAAIFMTSGDGSAPAFTHLLLSLINIPVKLLGLPFEGAAGWAGLFWGTAGAVVAFVWLLLAKALR